MNSIFFPLENRRKRPLYVLLILALWLSGLVLGVFLSLMYPDDSADLLTAIREVEGAASAAILPHCFIFAVAAFAIGFNIPFLCYLLVVVLGICRGFSGLLVFRILGSGAWLVRFFLMFSVGASSVLMFWLMIRHCGDRRKTVSADICLAFVILLVVVLCDVLFISPFLSGVA